MNKGRNYLFILFLIGLILVSCEDKIVSPAVASPSIVVPPPEYFAATVEYTGGFDFSSFFASYSGHVFWFGGADFSKSVHDATFEISLDVKTRDTGTILLSTTNYAVYTIIPPPDMSPPITCKTDSTHTGILHLTTFDTIKHLASGTFNFIVPYDGSGPNNDTISNGRFTNISW